MGSVVHHVHLAFLGKSCEVMAVLAPLSQASESSEETLDVTLEL